VNKNIRFRPFFRNWQVKKNIILVKKKEWDLLEIVNPIFYLTKIHIAQTAKLKFMKSAELLRKLSAGLLIPEDILKIMKEKTKMTMFIFLYQISED